MAAALAGGQATAPAPSTLVGSGYSLNFGGATVPPGVVAPTTASAGAGVSPSAWNPYASAGVNGSWAPTPMGKDPVLYAYYSSMGNTKANQILPVGADGKPLAPAAAAAPAATTPTAATTAAKPPADAAKPTAAAAPAAKTYTVVAGDTLSKIAGQLGVGGWESLYAANKDVVGGNPNAIKPGQVLKLP